MTTADILKHAGIYSPAFHAALKHVLQWEGGYSDHPEDPGGKTYKGITIGLLKQWRNAPVTADDLKNLQADEVYQIYHQLFWKAIRGDELPANIAAQLFDAAVNSGPKNAVLALQRALNGIKGLGFNVLEDGRIGPKSVNAAKAVKPEVLTREYYVRRLLFYGLLKTFRTFGIGWLRRAVAGYELAQKLLAAAKAVDSALK